MALHHVPDLDGPSRVRGGAPVDGGCGHRRSGRRTLIGAFHADKADFDGITDSTGNALTGQLVRAGFAQPSASSTPRPSSKGDCEFGVSWCTATRREPGRRRTTWQFAQWTNFHADCWPASAGFRHGRLEGPNARGSEPDAGLLGCGSRPGSPKRLREAAGEGRLELDELDERLEPTFSVKTYATCSITADLHAVSLLLQPPRRCRS